VGVNPGAHEMRTIDVRPSTQDVLICGLAKGGLGAIMNTEASDLGFAFLMDTEGKRRRLFLVRTALMVFKEHHC